MQVANAFRDVDVNDAWRLLNKAVAEQQDVIVERLFRLLGLLYDPKDMYHAYLGIVSSEKHVRAQALEFLDNLPEHEVKDHILGILDQDSKDKALHDGREFFENHIHSPEDGLRYLIGGNETWLQACAMNCVPHQGTDVLHHLIQENQCHEHPLISETAQFVMKRLQTQT